MYLKNKVGKKSIFRFWIKREQYSSLMVYSGMCVYSYLVVPEVVPLRQLLDARVNFEVVKDVDALHITEAVVQDAGELEAEQTGRIMINGTSKHTHRS